MVTYAESERKYIISFAASKGCRRTGLQHPTVTGVIPVQVNVAGSFVSEFYYIGYICFVTRVMPAGNYTILSPLFTSGG